MFLLSGLKAFFLSKAVDFFFFHLPKGESLFSEKKWIYWPLLHEPLKENTSFLFNLALSLLKSEELNSQAVLYSFIQPILNFTISFVYRHLTLMPLFQLIFPAILSQLSKNYLPRVNQMSVYITSTSLILKKLLLFKISKCIYIFTINFF